MFSCVANMIIKYENNRTYVVVTWSRGKCIFSTWAENNLLAAILNFQFQPNFIQTAFPYTWKQSHTIWKQQDLCCSHHGNQHAKLSFFIDDEALVVILNFQFLPMSCPTYLSPKPTSVTNIKRICIYVICGICNMYILNKLIDWLNCCYWYTNSGVTSSVL
jgi:hypothetical protein